LAFWLCDTCGTNQQPGEKTMVEETQNPYTPPKSDISIIPAKQGPGVKKVFSPAQGGVGAFLGGPVPGTYFVTATFLALGETKRARLTTIWGVVIVLAVLLWHFRLPEGLLSYSISIVYSVAAWVIIGRTQFTKPQIVASRTLTFHSNWRVAGVALVGLIITFVLARALSHLLSPR
jgi:hypothetical protein